jgi:SAM-dependent methyltransferase
MQDDKSTHRKFDHDAHARTRPRDDFWGQIRRTVNGTPVSEEQISLIVDAIKASLSLQKPDVLLDLACGNGALSHRLFDACAGLMGVDLSEFLISVAKENFESAPHFRFEHSDAVAYLRAETSPERFSKALCYGSFSYFSQDAARETLCLLHDKFSHIKSVFIGNLPDKDLAASFYTQAMPAAAEIADHESTIGIWRTRGEFAELARDAGWHAQVQVMPSGFWAAHYRYDVLLTRNAA